MFEKNYYSLVSGLREYALDSDAKGFDAAQIVGEILEELSRRDAEAVRLLYGYYDCENVAAARSGRTAYNALGNLRQEPSWREVAGSRLGYRSCSLVPFSGPAAGRLSLRFPRCLGFPWPPPRRARRRASRSCRSRRRALHFRGSRKCGARRRRPSANSSCPVRSASEAW